MFDRSFRGATGVVFVALAGLFAGTALAAAQPPATSAPAASAEPRMRSLEIQVQELGTGKEIARLAPGDSLDLAQGQRFTLRMTGLPADTNRSPRYPSTRFLVPAAGRQITIEGIDEKVGAITLMARQPTISGATVVQWEILSPFNVSEDQRNARIYLRVKTPEPVPAPQPAPEEPRSQPRALGVTMYDWEDYRGRSQRFTGDNPDLNGSMVENDAVSSVRIDPGCRLTIYEHQNYRGRSAVLEGDTRSLGRTPVGNDSATSFRLDCGNGDRGRGGPSRASRGVSLFDGEDYRGVEEALDRDDPDLRDNRIGDDRVRSLRVDRGCQVTLYEHANYGGRSMVVDRDLSTLYGTEIDRDNVSSLRVDCR